MLLSALLFLACNGNGKPMPSGNGLAPTKRASTEQAVLIHIPLSDDAFDSEEIDYLFALEETIASRIDESGIGEYDGNEIGGGELVIFLYGQDADALADLAMSVLDTHRLPAGSYLVKRYGQSGAAETRIEL